MTDRTEELRCFYRAVRCLRMAQKDYLSFRNEANLQSLKRQEKNVDDWLSRFQNGKPTEDLQAWVPDGWQ